MPDEDSWVTTGFQGEPLELAQWLINKQAIAVSDGSYKSCMGTAGWIISSTTTRSRITGRGRIPGDPNDQCSPRSEMGGLYAVLYTCYLVEQQFGLSTGQIEVGCDGEVALIQLAKKQLSPQVPHYDILSAIRNLRRKMSTQVIFRYVAGHQDDKPGQQLDRWAKLNIECDLLAKLEWQEAFYHSYRSKDSKISHEAWSIWVGHEKITGRLRTELEEVTTGSSLLKYWAKSSLFSHPQDSLLVNWDAVETAMKTLDLSRRRWITKHISGWCDVGKWLWDALDKVIGYYLVIYYIICSRWDGYSILYALVCASYWSN